MARKINCTKNGNDYFRVTTTIGRGSKGKLIRKEFYGKSKSNAENKKNEYLMGIKNGLRSDYKSITLGNLIHSWLFEIVRVSNKIKPSTFQRYEGIYRNYIENSELYGLKISNIMSLQFQRYYNKLKEDGKSSSIIKNLNKLLKTFFNYAVDEDYLVKNPCMGKKLVIPGGDIKLEQEIQVFSDEEIQILNQGFEGHRLKALILLALGTGLRQGELLALKWSDIDMKNIELKVQRSIKQVNIIAADGTREYKTIIQTPKSKNSNRTVPIPSSLIKVLKEHKVKQQEEKLKAGASYNKSDFVFTTEIGKTIDARNLVKCYARILVKCKIPYRKFHTTRHTYATKLFEANIPLKTVQILLGHSDISITANIYTHVMPKAKIIAAEELNHLFN